MCIHETALCVYAPLLKGLIMVFTVSLWHMVCPKRGHQWIRDKART